MPANYTRREFINKSTSAAVTLATGAHLFASCESVPAQDKPVVSIVRINQDRIDYAVEKAIDLLGGVETIAANRNRIMLKPNLVGASPDYTTKPEVIRALAQLMKRYNKEVLIGEGSAAAEGFNVINNQIYRTKKRDILDGMQQYVFDQLGYTELAASLGVPLVNLHTGEMVEVSIPDGLMFDKITMHHSLQEADLICSVPMMKTHVLATVTLGMKNLIGLYPGTVYYSARSWLHDHAARHESPGIAFEIIDMVKAGRPGLTVIDGSMAMEGDGPTDGSLLKMDLIIAGTNPLATDMVAAEVMGFRVSEVPHLDWSVRSGMTPSDLENIEIRGEMTGSVAHSFVKPNILSWNNISPFWAHEEL
jgi:uncharacterized protein (DUF362 family)